MHSLYIRPQVRSHYFKLLHVEKDVQHAGVEFVVAQHLHPRNKTNNISTEKGKLITQ